MLGAGLAVFLLLLAYLGLGVWIFAGLLMVGVTALLLINGFPLDRIGHILQTITWSAATRWELAAIPMFVWMGELMFRSDISDRLFRGLTPLVAGLPGRLLHINIAGCTLFAAVSGSSAATTATIGRITTKALRQRGYSRDLSIGSLAGAGSLGLMIPPSIVMIIYGVLAEVSISKMFIAGILPGLMTAGLFMLYIALVSTFREGITPPLREPHDWGAKLQGIVILLPALALVVAVLGSIYSGIATPSEAGAVGAFLSLVLVGATGQLTWPILRDSLLSAVATSAMLASILIAASFLSTVMGYLHVPASVAAMIAGLKLGPYGLILVLAVFYLLLGMFLEGVSITVMTLPITLPLVISAGFDPIWFGIFLIVMVELAQITPPVGFNLFILQNLSGEPITRVALAALPFFLLMCLSAVLLTLFPAIALWLPDRMS